MRILFITSLLVFVWIHSVRADALLDFERARAEYDEQHYMIAVNLLEHIISQADSSTARGSILLESRKYLAASYIFLGRTEEAKQQFIALLELDPTYDLDPVRYPQEVISVFESTRLEIERARVNTLQQTVEQQSNQIEQLEERERFLEQNIETLSDTSETVITRNSRWIAMLPLGVGQFQNGNKPLGIFFAVTESALGITALSTFAIHWRLRSINQPADQLAFNQREFISRIANQTSIVAFSTVMVVGILQAQIRFVSQHVSHRPRPTSEETTRQAVSPTINLGVGAGNLNFQLTF